MTTLAYYAISADQQAQLVQVLSQGYANQSKQKKLYEVQYTVYDLALFERPSNPSVYCLHRDILKGVIDHQRAQKAIEQAYGYRPIEFLPHARETFD